MNKAKSLADVECMGQKIVEHCRWVTSAGSMLFLPLNQQR